jgi:hypothetical protein
MEKVNDSEHSAYSWRQGGLFKAMPDMLETPEKMRGEICSLFRRNRVNERGTAMSSLTAGLLMIAFVGLLAYDLYLIVTRQQDATISAVVYDAACRHPIIPFLAGLVIAHILWPQDRRTP